MNICFIEPGMHLCGGIRRIVEVSNRLQSRGHSVIIYTPTGKRCTWIDNKLDIRSLNLLKKDYFDVAIFNLAEQYKLAFEANAKKKFFWVLAPEAEYKTPAIPVKALTTGKFLFLANSTYVVNYIKHFVKVDYDIPVIPGGINPSHFKYDPTIPKTYHVLYYGSSRPWKGTDLIENALRPLKLKILKMDGLNTPQKDMYKLYNQSTIFVSACKKEGFNFPILEAMTCGCPVVCTDDGGSRDFVKHNINAIVAPRCISGIQGAIKKLIDNKDLRRKVRTNGLITARSPTFTWENCTNLLESALINL